MRYTAQHVWMKSLTFHLRHYNMDYATCRRLHQPYNYKRIYYTIVPAQVVKNARRID